MIDHASSTFAPEEWDWAVDPPSPLEAPVIELPDIPVKEMYSLVVGVETLLASTLSITTTPGNCNPVVVVNAMVVSVSVIPPLRVVEKALLVPTFHIEAVIKISYKHKNHS